LTVQLSKNGDAIGITHRCIIGHRTGRELAEHFGGRQWA
jgi:hypothetical protein